MPTGNRSRYTQKPVQQPKQHAGQPEPPSPGGVTAQDVTASEPPVETKENPATEVQPTPVETKQQGQATAATIDPTTSTTSQPSSAEPSENIDFYYNDWGHRVIRYGKPVTVRAKRVNNRIVVCEDTVQEIPQQGTRKLSTHLLFFKGQEVSESVLQQIGARKITATTEGPAL